MGNYDGERQTYVSVDKYGLCIEGAFKGIRRDMADVVVASVDRASLVLVALQRQAAISE
jgi:hypothetical protein